MKQRILVSATALVLVGGVTAAAVFAVQNGTRKPHTITIVAGAGAKQSSSGADAAIAPGLARESGVTFVVKGQLPALDGNASAWRFAANPEPDLAAVARLAKALGLTGEVQTVEGGWRVGPDDGPALFVNKQAGLPWYYSGGPAVMIAKSCSGSSSDPSRPDVTAAPPVCPEPPKPTGVPTADEAKAKAIALLDAAGIDHTTATITAADNGGWSAYVQFAPKFDGVEVSSLVMTLSFAGQGAVDYGNGFLAAPVKADSYPRLGTMAAFENLQSDGVFGYGIAYATDLATGSGGVAKGVAATTAIAPGGTVTTAIAPDGAVTTATAPGATPNSALNSAPSPADSTGVSPSPTPCGLETVKPAETPTTSATATTPPVPCPTPEPRSVTISDVRETLLGVVGNDGSRWLVPGYLFIDTDGGQWPVLAIDKSFVEVAAPVPQVGSPAGSSGGSGSTGGSGGGSTGSSGSGDASTPPVGPKTTMVPVPTT